MSAKRVAAACLRDLRRRVQRRAVTTRLFLSSPPAPGRHVLPGFHGGAYVVAYVEDTSDRPLEREHGCDDDDCKRCPYNFEPRIILELADCSRRIELEFEIDSEAARANSLHKLDTLMAALRVFRTGIVAEFEPYDRRQREYDELDR